jgi:hypothetical protein
VRQCANREENLSVNFWVGTKVSKETARAFREAPLDLSATAGGDGGGGRRGGGGNARCENGSLEGGGGSGGGYSGGVGSGGGCVAGCGGSNGAEAVPDATSFAGTPPSPQISAPSPLIPADVPFPTAHAEAVSWLHASRMVESAAKSMFGDRGGAFITAMGAGQDAGWPVGSHARNVADRMRAELSGVLGGGGAVRTMLRLMTRDGRLYPGMAPPVEGPVVSAEPRRGDLRTTPPDQMELLRAEAERYSTMLRS